MGCGQPFLVLVLVMVAQEAAIGVLANTEDVRRLREVSKRLRLYHGEELAWLGERGLKPYWTAS